MRAHLTLVTIGGPDRPVFACLLAPVDLAASVGAADLSLGPWTTILEMADGIS